MHSNRGASSIAVFLNMKTYPNIERCPLKQLTLTLIVCLICGFGCATKNYYYHPEKTPAAIEMDYTNCMRSIDSGMNRRNPVSKPLRECMESKGYRLISKKEAEKLGVNTSGVWPPYASTTSSVGP